ncbi:MAG: hypothetical protein AB7K67_07445 [Hyphomicrobiaceae bacterium]
MDRPLHRCLALCLLVAASMMPAAVPAFAQSAGDATEAEAPFADPGNVDDPDIDRYYDASPLKSRLRADPFDVNAWEEAKRPAPPPAPPGAPAIQCIAGCDRPPAKGRS